jgi:hypothetical protein
MDMSLFVKVSPPHYCFVSPLSSPTPPYFLDPFPRFIQFIVDQRLFESGSSLHRTTILFLRFFVVVLIQLLIFGESIQLFSIHVII